MRRLTKTFLAVCSVLAFFSCKKNIESVDTSTTNKSGYSKTVKGDTIVHKLIVNGDVNTILEIKGRFYISDDMLINQEQFDFFKQQALANSSTIARSFVMKDKNGNPTRYTWPNGIVYFSYPVVGESLNNVPGLTEQEKNLFKETIDLAMREIADSSGIKFIERTNQSSYLRFYKSDENTANVGYWQNSVNPVNIAGMDRKNTIMHEILHALSFYHEHQRPDRNNHLTVTPNLVFGNVNGNIEGTPFRIITTLLDYRDYTSAFDYESIMLYGRGLGCIGAADCITKANGTPILSAEEKPGLSRGDAASLRKLYPLQGEYRVVNNAAYLYATNTLFNMTTQYVSSYANNYKFNITRNTDNITYTIKPSQLDKVFTYDSEDNKIILDDVGKEGQKFVIDFYTNGLVSIRPSGSVNKRIEFVGQTIRVNDVKDNANDQKIKLEKIL